MHTLVAEWRYTAAKLKSDGAVSQGCYLEFCASQLEAAVERAGTA
jgi:hypothetical protein